LFATGPCQNHARAKACAAQECEIALGSDQVKALTLQSSLSSIETQLAMERVSTE
jgi:hypothetical protein